MTLNIGAVFFVDVRAKVLQIMTERGMSLLFDSVSPSLKFFFKRIIFIFFFSPSSLENHIEKRTSSNLYVVLHPRKRHPWQTIILWDRHTEIRLTPSLQITFLFSTTQAILSVYVMESHYLTDISEALEPIQGTAELSSNPCV
jgi:hypothetical protein